MGLLESIKKQPENEDKGEPIIQSGQPRKVGQTDSHNIYVGEDGKHYYVPRKDVDPELVRTRSEEMSKPAREDEKWYNPPKEDSQEPEPPKIQEKERVEPEEEQETDSRQIVRGIPGKICVCGGCGAINILGE